MFSLKRCWTRRGGSKHSSVSLESLPDAPRPATTGRCGNSADDTNREPGRMLITGWRRAIAAYSFQHRMSPPRFVSDWQLFPRGRGVRHRSSAGCRLRCAGRLKKSHPLAMARLANLYFDGVGVQNAIWRWPPTGREKAVEQTEPETLCSGSPHFWRTISSASRM